MDEHGKGTWNFRLASNIVKYPLRSNKHIIKDCVFFCSMAIVFFFMLGPLICQTLCQMRAFHRNFHRRRKKLAYKMRQR